MAGSVSTATADYFRDGFDDVPSDLDEIAIRPDLSVIFESWEDQTAPVRDLNLTLGTQNKSRRPGAADRFEPGEVVREQQISPR